MKKQEVLKVHNECNICSGTEFIPGGGGRMVRGLPPRCKNCLSMERHRAVRSFFLMIPPEVLKPLKTIQFSEDSSVNPNWFDEFECSIYGKHNSLDLMQIDRPDQVYDLVICNHVLEHIKDDKQALRELIRITKSDGIVQISVPDPLYTTKTKDWGVADPKQWYHYRHYGADFLEVLKDPLKDMYVLSTLYVDFPTGRKEILYWILQSEAVMERLKKYFTRKQVQMSLVKKENANLKAQVETIYNSRSWRLTRPLRFGYAKLFRKYR